MLKKLINAIKSVFRPFTKTFNWITRNGKNGDNPVNPLTGQWLSTGWSFIVIVGFGIGEGIYNFIVNYLLEGFAILFNTVVNIGNGLWQSDHKFTRWTFAVIWSIGEALFSKLWMITRTIGAVAVTALMLLFEMFR